MAHFDGTTDDDKKLWHTYVSWARESAKSIPGAQPLVEKPAIVDNAGMRVSDSLACALQTILFCSFALEYRMRRVLEEMRVKLRSSTTLGPLLECFWTRLATVDRLDDGGRCQCPPEWSNCKPDLRLLVELRNAIAHANYRSVQRFFATHSSPESLACQLYNSVVEAVKLINIATGQDKRSQKEIDEYFKPLKVRYTQEIQMPTSRREIYGRVKAATVAICRNPSGNKLIPFGSGINVSPNGVVVTCKHVLEDLLVNRDEFPRVREGVLTGQIRMEDFVAVFSLMDKGRLELGIARFEHILGPHDIDLAVIRLRPDDELPFVELGDSDAVHEGDPIFSCGFPFGPSLQPGSPTGPLFHHGIIAGIRPHSTMFPRSRFLIDVTVNPGNSGGPLCSEESGHVVGIVNARFEESEIPTGIGFAVPSNPAKKWADRIMNLTDEDLARMARGERPFSD